MPINCGSLLAMRLERTTIIPTQNTKSRPLVSHVKQNPPFPPASRYLNTPSFLAVSHGFHIQCAISCHTRNHVSYMKHDKNRKNFATH